MDMVEKVPMTQAGYEQLNEELKVLKFKERPEIVAAIEEARAHGDLSENAEYHSAREKQSFIEGRIQDLEAAISRAQVIDPKTLSGDTVLFGATVQVQDLDTDQKQTYQIVGQYEANLEKGLISLISPLAKALIGKNKGDYVDVTTPKGDKSYEILSVSFI
jgi:transcription elongation factor GreA